jgi:2-keto-4-pentenoate hydratase/2-oxohepta-3-ene-1,7-dioic acid hydratase in catechol pathway
MVCPRISGDFDYEGELAVIIGKPGRHIAKSDALSHIFGYTCFNDGSVRETFSSNIRLPPVRTSTLPVALGLGSLLPTRSRTRLASTW